MSSTAIENSSHGNAAPATVYAWTDSGSDHTHILPDAAVHGRVRADVRLRRRLCGVPFVWCVNESRGLAGGRDDDAVAYHYSPQFRTVPRGPLAFRMKVVFQRRDAAPVCMRLLLSGDPAGHDRKAWRVVLTDYAGAEPRQLASRAVAFTDQLDHLVIDALPLDPPAGAPDTLVVRVETGPFRPADGHAPVARSLLLAGDMEAIQRDAAACDVVLRAQGRDLPAHRVILAGRSPVFGGMFRSDMTESREGVVVVEDMSFDTLRRLVAYLYAGRLVERLSPEEAMELFVAADRYQALDLRDGCVEATLSVPTCLPALALADDLGDPRLRDAALAFFAARRRDVCVRPGWAAPLESRPHLALQLLELLATEDE